MAGAHLEVALALWTYGYKLNLLGLVDVVTAGDADLLCQVVPLARDSL